ncbi:hypothetical protein KVV02_006614 [Mortierella alpina]|uniref:RGS domain-containing protein n=1 Tax=Mortierella alpina TaxID=64518 RepID=A0A9P8A6G3_MORAP|nr:hypothetical protein KVV02_006614 [Mortierella alpina]
MPCEPHTLSEFGEFLQSQFCSENLAFWLVAHEYKLCALALQRTIRESSPRFNLHQDSLEYMTIAQIRLFSDLQNDVLAILQAFKLVEGGDYHASVLQPSCESVFDLMRGSGYPLFLDSISTVVDAAGRSDYPSQPSSRVQTANRDLTYTHEFQRPTGTRSTTHGFEATAVLGPFLQEPETILNVKLTENGSLQEQETIKLAHVVFTAPYTHHIPIIKVLLIV